MPINVKEIDDGIVREAMALRVKYRVSKNGRVKRPVHINALCIHKNNRGGQYPQAGTVENLGVHIFTEGFNAEEANHEGVCVQEVPVNDRAPDYTSSYDWNVQQCKGTSLEGCFPQDGTVPSFGTLSHSHLLLTMLSWVNGLKWKIPCDAEGTHKRR